MNTSKVTALALAGLLSAVSLASVAASDHSTGKTDPIGSPPNPATEETRNSMGTGLDTNGGAIIQDGADPRTQGNDGNRQGLGTDVENGKIGPGKNATPSNIDDNLPGAPKQP
ncbi:MULTISPECIES: hypothetical protein [Pseudomonas]|uniref:Secreted protein n=1 Tax=Pseudomonas gessardii TaxID=78544 RepID=A0A7Y1MLZ6_9PSED|nr:MULTISPECIES: hypothetical protein [Pseudomonas]MBH3424216.1 hypothetical protein [Pseudomonas gessardii]MCF4979376.1 hypothetical protein [Pseudomonas gessardii]MCF4988827.1 hypothetical protein [Pseudomonas gessardii]MCF5098141.1 hypothetical protein [Pseudomonas gessardii]MCF5108767.1 hypothetical protein [Pseudomonas gessardii]